MLYVTEGLFRAFNLQRCIFNSLRVEYHVQCFPSYLAVQLYFLVLLTLYVGDGWPKTLIQQGKGWEILTDGWKIFAY